MRLGALEIVALRDGTLRLDGGAMFGVVPRTLWERSNPPDARNRILLSTTNLLVRTPEGETIVVDDGCGGKWDAKWLGIYGIERTGAGLLDALAARGVRPEGVDLVILTHLHFDHAGGTTVREAGGGLRPAFPRATHVLAERNLAEARSPGLQNRASYMPENWEPVAGAGLLEPYAGREAEIRKGIRGVVTDGHCQGHQVIYFRSGGETAVFLGDLIPTWSHIRLPWIMAYDLYPTETLAVKTDLLDRASAEGWVLISEHDPSHPFARVEKEGPEKYRVTPLPFAWGE